MMAKQVLAKNGRFSRSQKFLDYHVITPHFRNVTRATQGLSRGAKTGMCRGQGHNLPILPVSTLAAAIWGYKPFDTFITPTFLAYNPKFWSFNPTLRVSEFCRINTIKNSVVWVWW